MEYLDEVINMRIRPSDKQKLTALALSDNLSVSAYCRLRLLNDLEQSSKSKIVESRWKQLQQ